MNPPEHIRYLTSATEGDQPQARVLAQKWGLIYSEQTIDSLALRLSSEGLALVSYEAGAPGPVTVPWANGGGLRAPLGVRSELIARAAGLKAGVRPAVWDLTAGLGRDAFVLASLGCHVTLVERSSVLCALLDDALLRLAESSPAGASIAARMTLHKADARALLQAPPQFLLPPDVICLDPMYPHRTKQAAVKKEMRILRAVVGDDLDAHELLCLAQKQTVRRVVVKRPKHAPPLDNTPPDIVYKGNHTRFDVYLNANIHAQKQFNRGELSDCCINTTR